MLDASPRIPLLLNFSWCTSLRDSFELDMKSGQSWISYLIRDNVVALNFACVILTKFMHSSHVESNFEFLSFSLCPLEV
jgi:hypothetical protein